MPTKLLTHFRDGIPHRSPCRFEGKIEWRFISEVRLSEHRFATLPRFFAGDRSRIFEQSGYLRVRAKLRPEKTFVGSVLQKASHQISPARHKISDPTRIPNS